MRLSSIRTPSVDNLFILAESTFLSFAFYKQNVEQTRKKVINVQIQYGNDDITVYVYGLI